MRRGFGFNAQPFLSQKLLANLTDDLGVSLAALSLNFAPANLTSFFQDDIGISKADLTTLFKLQANLADDLGVSIATLTQAFNLMANIADDLGISRAIVTRVFNLQAQIADDLGISRSVLSAAWNLQSSFQDDLGISAAVLTQAWKLRAQIADDLGISAAVLTRIFQLQANIADDLGMSRAVLTRAWKLNAAIADDLGLSRAVLTRLWKLRALLADDTGVSIATLTRLWKLRALLADDLGITIASLTISSPSFTVNFLEDNTTTTTTANLSFATRTLGAADPNRFIVIGIHSGNNARTITSVTIGGVTATQLNQVAANTQTIAFFYALVPTGTTGTIAINRSSADNALQYGTWRVVSPTGLINVADVSICASPATQGNQVQNCRQGGTIFGILSATTPTITNFGIESGPDAGGCYMLRHPVVSGDGTSFTGNITSTTAIRLALASLYP